MSENIRRQLVALGIPEDAQDAPSLTRLFPLEFRVADAHLEAAEMAAVLLEFVRRGLISLSAVPTERAAAGHAAHAHVCLFYRSQDEMVSMTAAFLAAGAEAGERCLWVRPPWLDLHRAQAASRLARGREDPAGRTTYLSEPEVYLDARGILRDAGGIVEFWVDAERRARASGFAGLRIAGDGTGLVSTDAWASTTDYERRADRAFHGRRLSALCTYAIAAVPADRLADVLAAHRCGLVHRDGRWDELRAGPGVEAAIALLQLVGV